MNNETKESTAAGEAHTPGPWILRDKHPERSVYVIETADPSSDRRAPMFAGIASISRYGEPDENGAFSDEDAYYRGKQFAEVHLANARLIAAAPQLLAECETEAHMLENLIGDIRAGRRITEQGIENIRSRVTSLRAAIAAATTAPAVNQPQLVATAS